ncbi:MAG: site-2 protease family protein [Aureliella sp.]
MLRSWKLGTIRGIGVHIHWTFWLLMIFYTVPAILTDGLGAGLLTAAMMAAVFACVVAHEFGHAFTAAAFGIPTYDITLLPIGGVARLARMPEKPLQELIIALAGPAVNVVIAMLLAIALPLLQLPAGEIDLWRVDGGHFVQTLIAFNIGLVLFNLLPAFPMDGGRVLRSLIAMRTSHLRATEIAARVGRWMALLFVVAGLFTSFGLFLVGIFVFLAGTMELMEARRRAMAQQASRFQWGWSNVDPRRAAVNPRGDVIDAIEVREIKHAPQSGF